MWMDLNYEDFYVSCQYPQENVYFKEDTEQGR